MKGVVRILLGLLAAAASIAGPGFCQQEIVSQVSVVHYDALLAIDFEENSVSTKIDCTVQNSSKDVVNRLEFEFFPREKHLGVAVTVESVTQQTADGPVKQAFSRYIPEDIDDPLFEETEDHPRTTEVQLSPPIGPGDSAVLSFDYVWRPIDPAKKDGINPFVTLSSGRKEVCLLQDHHWLPEIATMALEDKADMLSRNWFTKTVKPTWEVTISTPPGYESVALGGRLISPERDGNNVATKWESNAPSYPQIMAGQFDRVVVKRPEINVVFYIPKESYNKKAVEKVGGFVARAYGFYSDSFGALDGEELHIGVNSINLGGHGGYLSMTLDAEQPYWSEWMLDPERSFLATLAHELAHSWWGSSVTSYGRGTKFLRESLANFSAWTLAQNAFGIDLFQEELAAHFWQGHNRGAVLFSPDRDARSQSYYKGPLVLRILETEMGEDVFRDTLRTFAARYKNDHATFSDFAAVCNEVSGKDWTDFFNQWCYGGGCPEYVLMDFRSEPKGDRWETSVTIRNQGQGTVLCPLELRMGDKDQREKFRVAGGESSTFVFETPAQAFEVEIDPDHNTYQGGADEAYRKLLAVGETHWEWMWYWRGLAYVQIGKYQEAIEDISRAIGCHMEAFGHASPAFSYTRGIAHLRTGSEESAREDFVAFLDDFLRDPETRIKSMARGAGNVDQYRQQWPTGMDEILRRLTGEEEVGIEKVVKETEGRRPVATWSWKPWQEWWKANKKTFQIAPEAKTLPPDGLRSLLDGNHGQTRKAARVETE